MEVRRIQEMAQQQIDFPQDFQHTSLKARSYTPSLDLGCHNVQGINVWANTAPRGWGSSSKDHRKSFFDLTKTYLFKELVPLLLAVLW